VGDRRYAALPMLRLDRSRAVGPLALPSIRAD
jgi:hypothetical protein